MRTLWKRGNWLRVAAGGDRRGASDLSGCGAAFSRSKNALSTNAGDIFRSNL